VELKKTERRPRYAAAASEGLDVATGPQQCGHKH